MSSRNQKFYFIPVGQETNPSYQADLDISLAYVSGTTKFLGAVTGVSSLNVSGGAFLQGSTTVLSNLNVSGVVTIGTAPFDASTALTVNNQMKFIEYGTTSVATTSVSSITENTTTSQDSRYMGAISLPTGFVDGTSISVVMTGTRGPGYGYIEGGSYIQDTTNTIRLIQLTYGNAGASGVAVITGTATTPITASMFPLKVYKYAAYPGWSVSAMTLDVTINYNISSTGLTSSFQQIASQGSYALVDNINSAPRLFIDQYGEVGIGGITTPSTFLHVTGQYLDAIAHFQANTTTGVNDAGIILGSVSGTTPFIGDNASTASAGLAFRTNNVERMRIDSTGKLGLGVTAPAANMHISGSSLFNGPITGYSTLNISGVTSMMGNVGIGTTTPGVKLQVEGNVCINRSKLTFSHAPNDFNHAIFNNSNNLDGEGSIDGLKINAYSCFWVRVGTASGAVPTTGMYINGSGQMGIGTTNTEGNMLKVDGGNSTSGISLGNFDTTGIKYIGITPTTGMPSNLGTSSGFSGITFGPPNPNTSTSGYLAFHTHYYGVNSSERMRIDRSGNVGIGTTAPVTTFHVNGNSYLAGAATAGSTLNVLSTGYFGGNLGIGTTSPAQPLTIQTSAATENAGAILLQDTNTAVRLRIGFNSNYSWIQSHNGQPLSINTLGNNVGIAITNPSALLHVNGTSIVTGAMTAGSTLRVIGTTTVPELQMSSITSGPAGLSAENNNILNMNLNFRPYGSTTTANVGGAFRIDGRNANTTPLYQWLYRAAGSSSEAGLMTLNSSGNMALGTGVSGSAPSMLYVSGTSAFNSNATFNSTLYVGGAMTANSTLNVNGNMNVLLTPVSYTFSAGNGGTATTGGGGGAGGIIVQQNGSTITPTTLATAGTNGNSTNGGGAGVGFGAGGGGGGTSIIASAFNGEYVQFDVGTATIIRTYGTYSDNSASYPLYTWALVGSNSASGPYNIVDHHSSGDKWGGPSTHNWVDFTTTQTTAYRYYRLIFLTFAGGYLIPTLFRIRDVNGSAISASSVSLSSTFPTAGSATFYINASPGTNNYFTSTPTYSGGGATYIGSTSTAYSSGSSTTTSLAGGFGGNGFVYINISGTEYFTQTSTSYTIPISGSAKIIVMGGGGSGGTTTNSGGGAGYIQTYTVSVSSGAVATITIGSSAANTSVVIGSTTYSANAGAVGAAYGGAGSSSGGNIGTNGFTSGNTDTNTTSQGSGVFSSFLTFVQGGAVLTASSSGVTASSLHITGSVNTAGNITGQSNLNISGTTSLMGNVAINNSTASTNLTVYTTGVGLRQTDNNVVLDLFTGADGSITAGEIGTFSNHPLGFYTNNNSAQMLLDTTGNFGIATITPAAKLHVNGTTILGGAVTTTSSLTVANAITALSTVNISGRTVISGSVGIGTTPVSAALHINNNVIRMGTIYEQLNVYFPEQIQWGNLGIGYSNITAGINGIGGPTGCGGILNLTTRLGNSTAYNGMYINNGNVGVGISTPSTMFHVNGNTILQGAASVTSTLNVNTSFSVGSGNNALTFTPGTIFNGTAAVSQAGSMWIELPGTGTVSLSDNIILNGGNFGINTLAPSVPLHVSGTSYFNGNMGIGTSSPNAILHVSGNAILQTATTIGSTLNVSGATTINGAMTANSSLNVVGNLRVNNIYPYADTITSGSTLNETINIVGHYINIGNANSVINILGTTTSVFTNEIMLEDPLIIVNSKSSSIYNLSGNDAGIQIDAISSVGYIKTTSDGTKFAVKAPQSSDIGYIVTKDNSDNVTITGTSIMKGASTHLSTLNISGSTIINNNLAVGRSSARYPADIVGTANYPLTGAAAQMIVSDSVGSGMMMLGLGTNGTNNYAAIQSSLSGTGAMPIAINPGGGNVSIGMTAGSSILQVNQQFSSTSALLEGPEVTLSTNNPANTYWKLGAVTGYVAAGAANDTSNYPGGLLFKTKVQDGSNTSALVSRMALDSRGFLGVGTLAPSTMLHVSGASTLNGAATITSTLNVSGNTVLGGTLLLNGNPVMVHKELAAAPSNPNLGDEWYNTSTSVLYKYINSNWVAAPVATPSLVSYRNFTGSESIVTVYNQIWFSWTAPVACNIASLTVQASGGLNNGGFIGINIWLNGNLVFSQAYNAINSVTDNVISMAWSATRLEAGQVFSIQWSTFATGRYMQVRSTANSDLPVIFTYTSNTGYVNMFGLSVTGTTLLQSATTAVSTLNVSGASVFNSTINVPNMSASTVLVIDSSKNVVASNVSTTTLSYLDATSSIQTQLNSMSTSASSGAQTITGLKTYQSTSNNTPNIVFTGAALNNSTDNNGGIGLELYHNTVGNRQIAMIDSAISRSGTSYSVLRFGVGYSVGTPFIDAVSNDGNAAHRQLSLGNSGGGVTMNGNVGIGTTSPAYALDVTGSIRSQSNAFIGNGSTSVRINLWDIPNAAWQMTTGSYNLSFNNGTIGGSLTNRMTLTQTGNMGIGTTAPTSSLHISNNTGNRTNSVYINTPQAGIMLDSTQSTNGKTYNIWSSSNGDSTGAGFLNIFDVTSSQYRMVISSNGNVGINTVAPQFNLHVGTDASPGTVATGTLRLQPNYNGAGQYGFNISAVDNGVDGHNMVFTSRAGPTDAFYEVARLTNRGLMGIGTNAPAARLHVSGNTIITNGATILSSLNVSGSTNITNGATVVSTLNVSGNTVITGTLTVNNYPTMVHKELGTSPSGPNLGDEHYNTSTSMLSKYMANSWYTLPFIKGKLYAFSAGAGGAAGTSGAAGGGGAGGIVVQQNGVTVVPTTVATVGTNGNTGNGGAGGVGFGAGGGGSGTASTGSLAGGVGANGFVYMFSDYEEYFTQSTGTFTVNFPGIFKILVMGKGGSGGIDSMRGGGGAGFIQAYKVELIKGTVATITLDTTNTTAVINNITYTGTSGDSGSTNASGGAGSSSGGGSNTSPSGATSGFSGGNSNTNTTSQGTAVFNNLSTTVMTDSMTTNYLGMVGIGTPLPTATLHVSGNSIISGASTISSSLLVSSAVTTLSSLNISGNTTMNGPITAVSSINVSGNSTVVGNMNISGASSLMGNVAINNSTAPTNLTVYTTGNGIRQTNNTVALDIYTGNDGTLTAGKVGTSTNHPLAFYTNNNAARMVLDTSGRLGVNTTAPAANLHVSGTSVIEGATTLNSTLRVNNTSILSTTGIGTSNPVGALTVALGDAGTNIGQGNWNSKYLLVTNDTSGSASASGMGFSYSSSKGGVISAVIPGSTFINMNYIAQAHFISCGGSNTQVLTVADNGNVGIGTTGPSSLLHVAGNSLLAGTVVATGALTTNSTLYVAGSSIHNGTTVFNGAVTYNSNLTMAYNQVLRVNGSATASSTGLFSMGGNGEFQVDAPSIIGGRMIIKDSGNVGIANSAPSYKLDVGGDIRASGSMIVGSGGAYVPGTIFSDTQWGMILRAKTAAPTMAEFLFSNAADTHRMAIATNGNLGVGTSAPDSYYRIHAVQSANDCVITADCTNSTQYAYFCARANGTVGYFGQTNTGDSFITNGSNRIMTFSSGANVGIGTTAPTSKLHLHTTSINPNQFTLTNSSGMQLAIWGSATGLSLDTYNTSTATRPPLCLNESGGRVGIGMVAPDSTLHVIGSTAGSNGGGAGSVVHIKQNTSWSSALPFALYVEGYTYLNGFRINAADEQRALYKVAAGGAMGFATNGATPITFSINDASEIMRISGNGYVGIGTAGPTTMLHVNGASTLGGATTVTSTLNVASNMAVGGTTVMSGAVSTGSTLTVASTATLNGNVNIGNSGSGNAFPLNVGGTAESYSMTGSAKSQYFNSGTVMVVMPTYGAGATNVTSNAAALIDFANYSTTDGNTNAYIGAVGGATGTSNLSSHLVFGRRSAVFSWTESMRIDTIGRVGIATTTPSDTLHVSGTAKINGSMTALSTLNVGGAAVINGATSLASTLNVAGQTIVNGYVGIGTTTPDWPLTVKGVMQLIDNTTSQKYALYSDNNVFQLNPRSAAGLHNGTTGLVMNNSGNVGIGMYTTAAMLHVSGTTILAGASTVTSTLNVSGNTSIRGNVAIGSATAVVPLDVNGTILARNYNVPGYQGAYMGWNRSGGTGEVNLMCQQGLGIGGFSFELWNNSNTIVSTLMVINGNNNFVGINNTAPSAMLDVNGTMLARGPLTTNSTLFAAGAATMASTLKVSGNTSIMGTLGVGIAAPTSAMQIHSALASGTTGLWEAADLRFTYNAGGGMWDLGRISGYVAANTNNDTANWPGGLLFQTKPPTTIGALAITRMVIDSNGNVGVGTTAPKALHHVSGTSMIGGAMTASSTLNVGGATTLVSTLNVSGNSMMVGSVGIGSVVPPGTTKFQVTGANNGAAVPQQMIIADSSNTNQQLLIGTSTNGYSSLQGILQGVALNNLSLNPAGGNVGVGITNPSALFHVAGTSLVTGAMTASSTLNVSGTSIFNGNVGIGTTTPDWPLSVKGVMQLIDPVTSQKYAMYSDNNVLSLNPRTTTGGYSNVTGLVMNTSGNVGIGIGAPTALLHVSGTSILSGASTHGSTLNVVGGVSMASTLNVSGTTSIMGNLGIGTTSPAYALDVNGDMKINNTLYVQNETTDIDNRYDINTFMKPLTSYFSTGSSVSTLTYTTDASSPVGTEIVQTSSYMWVNGPLIRLDRTKNYEVEMWIRRTAVGATASFYMVVANFDSAKVNISGVDGAQWHYPVLGKPQTEYVLNTWYNHRFVVGPYGGARDHASNARYISLGFIANYQTGTDTFQLTGFKIKPIARYNNDALTITNSGNVGLSTTAPTASLHVSGTSIISGALTAGSTLNVAGAMTVSGLNATALTSTSTMNISGNTVIMGTASVGTATAKGLIQAYNPLTTSQYNLTLTGAEYYQPSLNTSTDGIAIVLGVNRPANRQLWMMDTALAVNTTNTALRFNPNSSYIDAISTDGTTQKPLTLGFGVIMIGGATSTSTMNISGTTVMNAAVSAVSTLFVGGASTMGSTLNVSGMLTASSTSIMSGATTINSTLNVSTSVGIGNVATPSALLELNRTTYSSALLVIDAGTGLGNAPRGIGQPLMRLGKTSYSSTPGDYYGMSMGYAADSTVFACTEIGTLITDKTGNETGDIVFSTRPNTSNIVATERLRINSTGMVGINTSAASATLHVSGTSIITGAATTNSTLFVAGAITGLSSLNISGTSTLNTAIITGPVSTSSTLYVGNSMIAASSLNVVGNLRVNNIYPYQDTITSGTTLNETINIVGHYINIGNSTSVINILGTTTSVFTNEIIVEDPLIVINAKSAGIYNTLGNDAGIQIDAISSVGYLKTSTDGTKFAVKAPQSADIGYIVTKDNSDNLVITGTTTMKSATTVVSTLNVSGTTMLLGAVTTGSSLNVVGQVNTSQLNSNTISSFGGSGLGIYAASNPMSFYVNSVNGMNLTNNGYLGIGISSPAQPLHVYNTTSGLGIAIDAPAAATTQFQANSAGVQAWSIYRQANTTNLGIYMTTSAVNAMTILGSNGNIGIGMNAPTAMLHVTGTSILGGASTHGSTLNVVGSVSMASTLNVSGTSTFNSNVGIGTTNPTSLLHMYSASNPGVFLNSAQGGSYWGVATAPGNYALNAITGDTVLRSESTTSRLLLSIGAGNAPVIITSSGMGIGVAPTVSMHISGTTIMTNAATASSTLNVVGSVSMASTLNISGTTSIMGNMGIGTTAPTHSLHIARGNDSLRLGATGYVGTAANSTTYGLERSRNQILFTSYRDAWVTDRIGAKIAGINKQTYDDAGARQAVQSTDIAFFTVPPSALNADETIERFRIMDTGNVGIGTSGPSALLHVNGTTIIGGAMTANSTLNVGGASSFNGNMGIGAVAGSFPLVVNSGADMANDSISWKNNTYELGRLGFSGSNAGWLGLFSSGAVTTVLRANGTSTLNGGSVGVGVTTASALLHVSGTSILGGASTHGSTLNVAGAFVGSSTAIVSGASTMASTLNVSGTAYFSELQMSGITSGPAGLSTESINILNMNLNFRPSGSVITANVGASFRIDGRNTSTTPLYQWLYRPDGSAVTSAIMTLNSSGNLALGTLHFGSAPTMLYVSGTSAFNSASTFNSSLYVGGNITVASNLNVMGSINLASANIGGAATAVSSLTVSGVAVLTNAMTAGSTMYVAGATTMASTLNVSGTTSIMGNLGVGTMTPLQALHVDGGNIGINSKSEMTGRSALYFYNNPYMTNGNIAAKTAIITEAINRYTQSKLHLCVNDTDDLATSATLANARLTVNTNGNVGIGTTNPSTSLHVSGTSTLGGATTLASTLNVAGAMTTGSTLNVTGIMTAASTSVLSGATTVVSSFNVSGTASFQGTTTVVNSNGPLFGLSDTISGSWFGQYNTTSNSWLTGGVQGDMFIRASKSLLLGVNNAAQIATLRLDANGNVGIGNNAPTALLHVSGTSILGGASTHSSTLNIMGAMVAASTLNVAGVATINNTTNIAGNMNVTGSTIFNNPGGDTWQTSININNNSSVAAYQLLVGGSGNGSGTAGVGGFAIHGGVSGSASFKLNINSNGNVGIGKTDPQALLHVSGTSILAGASTHGSTLNIMGALSAASTSVLTGAVTALSTVNISGQTVISGSVGIGVTPVSAALHINNNVIRMGTIYETLNVNYPEQIQWGNIGGMGYSNITAGINGIGGPTGCGGILNLSTRLGNSTAYNGMYINNGNVGIGISTPSTMFHVNGNSLLQGTATVTSTLTVSGAMTSNSTLNVAGNTFVAGTMSIGTTSNSYPLTINSSSNPCKLALLEPSTGNNYITFNSNALARGYVGLENSTGSGLFGSNSAYGMSIGTNQNGGVLAFATNNVIRTTIDTSGNMGIATASPSAVLHVNGTSILSGASTHGSTLNIAGALVAASTAVVSGAASTNSTLNVSGTATFNSNVNVASSGLGAFSLNVGGVGEQYTMTQSAKSQYFNSGTMVAIVPSSVGSVTTNSSVLIDFGNYSTTAGNTNAYIGSVGGNASGGPSHLVFGRRTGVSSWAESMRIDLSGNMGIGTNAPSALLHVSGTSILGGASTHSSTLNTVGLLTATGGLTSVGITSSSTMNVSGLATLNTAIVSGAMTTSSSLNTVGTMTTAGALNALNGISVSGTTILNSNVTMGSSLSVTGVVTAVSTMNVGGAFVANSSSVLVGATTHSSSLYVSGTSAFMNSMAIGTTTATGLLTLNGTSTSLLGPHINIFNTGSTYPTYQQLNWSADNIAQNFDMYWDGSWRNSTSGWGYQTYKISNKLTFFAMNSGAAGSSGSILTVMTMSGANVGINNPTPSATFHVSGATILGGSATIQSTLNISGNTIMNTAATASSTLNVAGALTVVGSTVMNGAVSNTATLSVVGAITANSNLSVSGNTTIMGTANVGTNGVKGLLQSFNRTGTSQYHLTLTGAEFYEPSNTSADGVGLTAGVNRTGNRQLWVADTAMAINTTNVAFRIMPSQGAMDAVSTDGTVGKVFTIGNAMGVVMNGSSTVGSNLNITSNMNVGGTSVLVGAVSNNSTLYNTGAVSMGSSLTVSGTSILTSAVSVGSTLSVTGAATMNSSLNVVGNMRVNNIYPYADTITSASTLSETINIVGHYINIGNSNSIINIQGTTTSVFTNEIIVEDPLIVVNSKTSGTYNTSGNDAGIQIDAISSVGYLKTTSDGMKFAVKAPQSADIGYIVTKDNSDNLVITGTTTLKSAMTALSTLNVSGATFMNSAATANSTLNVVGAMAAASTLIVSGAVSMSSTLSVTGAVTANSTMNVVGAFNAASTTVLTNATTVGSTLNVNGATTVASSLNVSGVATLSNKLIFNPTIGQAPASIGQIDTSNTVNFINPAAAVTGVTLLAGTTTGQMFMCVNRSAFDVTLDSTDATAFVANSFNTILYAKTTVIFVWNATDALWYPTRDTY